MFEEDLLDEEIKKKKRRVLVGLFFLLLGVALVAFPLAELSSLSATPVSEAVVDTPTHTATSAPTPEATATSPPEATPPPQPAATATLVPTTEETPGGVGGGTPMTPTASPTATSTPTETSPPPATPTPLEPGELPVTGASAGWGIGWPALGLVAISLGTYMLRTGHALRNTRPGQ